LSVQNGMLGEVKRNLKQCGYSDPLLQANYLYEDDLRRRHIVPLAGFASSVHDARTSCISVIASEDSAEIRPEYVNKYRGLGAPVVFVCCNGTIQWWAIRREGAEWKDTFNKDQLNDFFAKRKDDFKPDRLWRAKNLGRLDKDQQLRFVDIGLMPLLEHEMGERLGGLMKRVLDSLRGALTDEQQEKPESQQWIFRTAFWLLCAKILKDKGVRRFAGLQIDDVDAVLEAVRIHYGAQDKIELKTLRQRNAIEESVGKISTFASLSNLTTEAFGYMYENLLVHKKLRSALGIHATPSYLVDYIVWQLWPWIKQIPEDRRVVLEPACGHAPFLTGAMRLLRELFEGDEKAFHKYAKRNLVGIEVDSFACEIARPSLTIADVPNHNGWNILEGDIYHGDVLSKKAKDAMILLCNPPFEDFKPKEQDDFKKAGEELRFYNKAAEMLWRTLPHMPKGSVFGVILPRVFLQAKELADLRKMIVSDFELSEICLLPANIFAKAKLKSVALMGIKRPPQKRFIQYTIVPPDRRKYFEESYQADKEMVPLKEIQSRQDYSLTYIPLKEVWEYCRNLPTLRSVARVGRGIEYKSVESSTSRAQLTGAEQGFVRFEKTIQDRRGQRKKVDIKLTQLPDLYWMDLSDEGIANPRYGMPTGQARLLLNYARSSQDKPWRLKGLIDEQGRPTTNCCMTITPRSVDWNTDVLWAVVNSPFSNAFVFSHSMERHNLETTIRNIPLPSCGKEELERISRLMRDYFALDREENRILSIEPDRKELKQRLLLIDAELMRLYDLPPKMEKRLLELFQGCQRKGVDFEFKGYYPEGFESAVPLHEFLSEEYQRSTVSFVKKWVEDNRSPEIIKAFERASEAFDKE